MAKLTIALEEAQATIGVRRDAYTSEKERRLDFVTFYVATNAGELGEAEAVLDRYRVKQGRQGRGAVLPIRLPLDQLGATLRRLLQAIDENDLRE